MEGWNNQSVAEQSTAQKQYEEFRAARGGDAEARAVKRIRLARPKRHIQLSLPFVNVPRLVAAVADHCPPSKLTPAER